MNTESLRYGKLRLPAAAPFSDYEFERENILQNLSLVNIFVGTNNTGKSRLLRSLFALEQIEFSPSHDVFGPIFNLIKKCNSEMLTSLGPAVFEVGNVNRGLFEEILKHDREFFQADEKFMALCESKVSHLSQTHGSSVSHNGTFSGSGEAIAGKLRSIGQRFMGDLTQIASEIPGLKRRIYIPILRGMRPLKGHDENLYWERTNLDYFPKIKVDAERYVFTGLELFSLLKQKLLGEPEDRELVRGFEQFLSQEFFPGRQITLIPRETDHTVHVKIGSAKQLPIYFLGDGIQTLIILAFHIFTQRAECMFFIEEPELSMHPGFQRSFLNILFRFPQHQYFLTTHSNHLLDMCMDANRIAIFLHTKSPEDPTAKILVRTIKTADENVLKELGVRTSSVFLSNCTIWIEGITDRRYLLRFLELYEESIGGRKLYKEDLHFSFVEYSGSNITHWSFLDRETDPIEVDRLCGRAFLIADRDDPNNAAKQERRKKLTEKLKERFYPLKCREIENLLPSETLASVVRSYEGDDASLADFQHIDYAEKPLGTFIEDELLKGGKKRRGRYAAKSGTIEDKVEFCERALGELKSFDQLTAEAKDLTTKLHEFIHKHNE